VITCGKLVFESLQPRLFLLFVNIGFPDVFTLVDLVDIRFSEFRYVEGVVDFTPIETSDLLSVDACLFKSFDDGLLVFQRLVAPTGSLDRAERPTDWLVVMQSIQQHVCNLFAETVGIALDI